MHVISSHEYLKIYPDKRPDETVLRTLLSCTGEDVEAKFTSDQPHAVKTRHDWPTPPLLGMPLQNLATTHASSPCHR